MRYKQKKKIYTWVKSWLRDLVNVFAKQSISGDLSVLCHPVCFNFRTPNFVPAKCCVLPLFLPVELGFENSLDEIGPKIYHKTKMKLAKI